MIEGGSRNAEVGKIRQTSEIGKLNNGTNNDIDINSFLGLIETGWLCIMIRKIQALLSKAKTVETRGDEAAINVDESTSVEQRIKAIMANVFRIDINDINEETSADNMDQWTSLEHVDFLVNLQKDFDIEFTDSQIVEMLSYLSVVQNVRAAITNKNN